MNVRHFHKPISNSTHNDLRALLKKNPTLLEENVLISTSKQTNGIGRQNNKWDYYTNSLAFSFTIKPSQEITLTPLELSVLIVDFFKKQNIKLKLKWPNDLFTIDGKKCGGILCSMLDDKTIISSIGLNLIPQKSETEHFYKHPLGFVFPDNNSTNINIETLMPLELYNYILSSRLSNQETLANWNLNCFHYNFKVKIDETVGIFTGISEKGEAMLLSNGKTIYFLSGSLEIINPQ